MADNCPCCLKIASNLLSILIASITLDCFLDIFDQKNYRFQMHCLFIYMCFAGMFCPVWDEQRLSLYTLSKCCYRAQIKKKKVLCFADWYRMSMFLGHLVFIRSTICPLQGLKWFTTLNPQLMKDYVCPPYEQSTETQGILPCHCVSL